MIKKVYELYCDHCGCKIATVDRENDVYDYPHGRGYVRGDAHIMQNNFFCNETCKDEFYKERKAEEVLEWV